MIGNTVGMDAHAGVENCTKQQKGENTNGNKKKVSACKFWCLIVCVKVTNETMKDKSCNLHVLLQPSFWTSL